MAQPGTANIRQTLTRRCARLGIPVSGTFELTPRCNLRCRMCYVRLTPEEMALIGRERTCEEWLALARQARQAGMVFLLLTGGEPTLRSDFCRLYEELAQMGFSISINTNGSLLSSQLRTLWNRLPPAQVNITLYGTCREDYAALCGDGHAFDAVEETLDWLKQEGILVRLNTTMTPVNAHKLTEIETYAKNRGLELRVTAYCFPPVRRTECGSCEGFVRLSPEQAAEAAVQDVLYREGPQGILLRANRKLPPQEDSCSLDVGEPMRCMAGRSTFWVTWDGRMTPCGMLDQPVTRPFDPAGDFAQSWDTLRHATEQIRLCPDCQNCRERQSCMNCAAVTYAETGSFHGKPEYMCAFNRAYRDAVLRLTEQFRREP